MRRRLSTLALAAAALSGCDDGDERTPPPPDPTIGDPVTYFAVPACRCMEYVPEDENSPMRLGIAIESVSDIYTQGVEQHVARYRVNGQVRRVDFYTPTDPVLKLAWVNLGQGDNDQYFEIEGGLPFVTGPVEAQSSVMAQASVKEKIFGAEQGAPTTASLRADYTPDQAVLASLDGGPRQSFTATRVLYSGLPWDERVRWFVPEIGFVQLELTLDDQSGRVKWILNNVRTLEGGCPWRPGDPPQDTCGI